MRKFSAQLIKLAVFILVTVSTVGIPAISSGASKYDSCDFKVEFWLNDKVFTGEKIFRDPKNKYQLKLTINQPDGTACQPAFFWQIALSQYNIGANPSTAGAPKAFDSGQIVSNLAFAKTIDLGRAGLQNYVYTFSLAADRNFTQEVASKTRTIAFTDDPKAASSTTTPGGGVGIGAVPKFDEKIGTLFNPLDENMTSPSQIIVRLINIALFLVGILAVLFIIVGGFLMVTSAGNETRLRQGKQTLIWAVAGLILSLLSFSIVAIVQSIIT